LGKYWFLSLIEINRINKKCINSSNFLELPNLYNDTNELTIRVGIKRIKYVKLPRKCIKEDGISRN
jgi:hypothetical protein